MNKAQLKTLEDRLLAERAGILKELGYFDDNYITTTRAASET